MAAGLRRKVAGLAGELSVLFVLLTVLAFGLLALCVLVVFVGEANIFLTAPLGFKDESLTGLPALAGIVALASLGSTPTLWFVARLLEAWSHKWRCLEYYAPAIRHDHTLRCWLAPNHEGQHFCQVSGRSYYWQVCARCGKPIVGSESCEKSRLQTAAQAEQQARERVQADELARSRVRALGWEDMESDGKSALERAVEAAIEETGAASLMQMGSVIKAARGRLADKSFDEKQLRHVVRARLLALAAGRKRFRPQESVEVSGKGFALSLARTWSRPVASFKQSSVSAA